MDLYSHFLTKQPIYPTQGDVAFRPQASEVSEYRWSLIGLNEPSQDPRNVKGVQYIAVYSKRMSIKVFTSFLELIPISFSR